ncbi:MAG: hypothetical protein GY805_02305 [Chloroflexi bacterium]|nr:hypothetical protein [Chloroflexota bacterium]
MFTKRKKLVYLLGFMLLFVTSITQVQAADPVREPQEQRINIQQYASIDEAIEDIARRTGKSVDETRKQIENSRQTNQSSETHRQKDIFMGFGGHYEIFQPDPCFGLGKAWAMWQTDQGTGTITFHGNLPLGTWQAGWTCIGSGGCLFIADALMFAGEEIWAYEVDANDTWNWTNDYANWCTAQI